MKLRIAPKLSALKVPARIPFPVSDELVRRQLEAAKSCPVNKIRPVLCDGNPVQVSEWSFDANGSPV